MRCEKMGAGVECYLSPNQRNALARPGMTRVLVNKALPHNERANIAKASRY